MIITKIQSPSKERILLRFIGIFTFFYLFYGFIGIFQNIAVL